MTATVGGMPAWFAKIGPRVATLGGVLALVAFFVIPVLVGGVDGSRTGSQVAASSGLPLMFWLVPVAAVVLILLGVTKGRRWPAGIVVVAGIALLGHIVALMCLSRPAGAAEAYAAGIDPASAVGPAYWVSIGCLVAALAGGLPDLLSLLFLHSRPYVAGAAAGVALGTIIASVVLDVRQDESRRGVVLLAADTPAEAAFRPDFTTRHTAMAPAVAGGGDASGDKESLYGGMFDRSSCDRDRIATSVAEASPARSGNWVLAATSDSHTLPPTDARRYISELTPVDVRADTRVTAHGFIGDQAYPYQSVLQAGTAVLVDRRGIPRVRCAGAIPIAPPRGTVDGADYRGPQWPGFNAAALVTVTPAPSDIRQFGLTGDGRLFRRPAGTNGSRDVDQVPAQALIDGTYVLGGRQTTCNLTDCDSLTTRTITVTVTGCPDLCVIAGGEWAGTPKMVESMGYWTASGKPIPPFKCHGSPVTTTFTVRLRVKTGTVVDGLWTAEQLEGVYGKNSTGAACSDGVLSWNVTGTRR
jgi:hypothetical protein